MEEHWHLALHIYLRVASLDFVRAVYGPGLHCVAFVFRVEEKNALDGIEYIAIYTDPGIHVVYNTHWWLAFVLLK